jgi:phosphate starvation-inducible protein PhoH
MVTLDRSDVVRHELVQRIIDAYENARDRSASPDDAGVRPAPEERLDA